jgi:hypothetical protein
MSPVRKTTTNDGSGSGSRIDVPQKPNCWSPVQGLERQGFRRHLPSRSSVRAELRDGNTHTCDWIVLMFVLLSYRRDMSSHPFNLSSLEGKVKGLTCGYSRNGHLKSLTRSPAVNACYKIKQPNHASPARRLPACLATPSPSTAVRMRVARLCSFLNISK